MKKVILALFLVILGGAIGGGVMWVWQNYELKQKEEVMAVGSPLPEASVKPMVSVKPEAVLDEEGEYSDWLSYQNPIYGYGFKYDGDWSLNDAMPGSDQYERVVVQGDVSTKGWPTINIGLAKPAATFTELKTNLEALFVDTMTVEETVFGKGMISAVKVASEQSPMAYATESYYFIHNGNVISIYLNDVDPTEARVVYDYFLSQFEVF